MSRSAPVVIAITLALAGASGAPSARLVAELDAALPAWLAPGVTLAASGSADPGTVIAVERAGAMIVSTTVGEGWAFLGPERAHSRGRSPRHRFEER
jgi:hypothetical protein